MNRRTFFGLGLAPWFAAAATAADIAPLTDPRNRLAVYARMRGNGVGGPKGIWWIAGTIYAKQTDEMVRPLIGMAGVSINHIVGGENGGIVQTMEEAGYFSDLVTGDIVDEWRNPLTGDMRRPEPYRMTVTQIIRADGAVERPPNPRFPMEVTGGLSSVQVYGDVAWIEENTSARVPLLGPSAPGRPPEIVPGRTRVIDNLATFQCRVADLLAPEGTFVPSTLAYQETDPWFPWMGMGDRAGLQIWQVKGRKLRSIDETPPGLLRRLQHDHPGFGA